MAMIGGSRVASGNNNSQIRNSGIQRRKVRLSWLQADYGNKRNHCKASISRIASSALISPRCRRSRISDRGGVGLVSTNSRVLATFAAFGEEIGYRGYLINRAADVGGRSKVAYWVAVLAGSVLFRCGHFYKGAAGILGFRHGRI